MTDDNNGWEFIGLGFLKDYKPQRYGLITAYPHVYDMTPAHKPWWTKLYNWARRKTRGSSKSAERHKGEGTDGEGPNCK